MIRQIPFSFSNRPAWQRYLLIFSTILITAFLFWIGIIVVFTLAFVALAVALVNKIKVKLTGRPLFKGPQHFHRYQSQFSQGNEPHSSKTGKIIEGEIIEGEIVDRKD